MKKADLEKLKGKRITGAGFGGAGDRFGRGSAEHADKREQLYGALRRLIAASPTGRVRKHYLNILLVARRLRL